MPAPFIPDTSAIRRRVIYRVLTSPLTVLPFITGMTALIGTWALDTNPELGALALLAGVCGTAGVFVSKLILRGEDHAKDAMNELQEEAVQANERSLDDLESRLRRDRDPRTQAALRDLRALTRALNELTDSQADSPLAVEIRAGASKLFDECVATLEQSLKLWHTARELRTRPAREPIMERRDEILQDVFESIRYLGDLLVTMRRLDSADGDDSELNGVREELNRNLEVARGVSERLRAFDQELQSPTHE